MYPGSRTKRGSRSQKKEPEHFLGSYILGILLYFPIATGPNLGCVCVQSVHIIWAQIIWAQDQKRGLEAKAGEPQTFWELLPLAVTLPTWPLQAVGGHVVAAAAAMFSQPILGRIGLLVYVMCVPPSP